MKVTLVVPLVQKVIIVPQLALQIAPFAQLVKIVWMKTQNRLIVGLENFFLMEQLYVLIVLMATTTMLLSLKIVLYAQLVVIVQILKLHLPLVRPEHLVLWKLPAVLHVKEDTTAQAKPVLVLYAQLAATAQIRLSSQHHQGAQLEPTVKKVTMGVPAVRLVR